MAASSALLILAFACAPPNPTRVGALVSPTPSPSPTPAAPLQAAGPGFHGGEVGIAFAPIALTASGGLAPYTWTVSSGALPPGLVLGGDGGVSGTPTGGGAYKFTIQVADSAGGTSTIDGGISIADRLTAHLNPSCAQSCNVELGCADACGDFGSLTGGVPPITFSLAGGTLPVGTSLNGFSLKGTFKGLSGYLKFTVQATDGLGATTAVTPTFWMYDHLSLGSGTCYSTYYPFPCSGSLPFSGGTPGTGLSVAVASASGSLCLRGATGAWVCNPTSNPPPKFTAAVGNGVVNVSVPGQPNNPYEYSGTVTLVLTAQDFCQSGVMCSATGTVKVTFAGG